MCLKNIWKLKVVNRWSRRERYWLCRIVRLGGGVKSNYFFKEIISVKSLFAAWEDFKYGKRKKLDVVLFEKNYKKEIFKLYDALRGKKYRHGAYETFYVKDPKLRKINKASVLDRILHHAVFRKLYELFDRKFIFDSYSCRVEKGTHRAVRRLQEFFHKESKNNSRVVYVLKCDIKKFFDSIDQDILLDLIRRTIKDNEVLWLLEVIIKSFGKGLPLGNITSQLFANIYLDELDQFMKQDLKVKYYIRYCDDFVVLHEDRRYLESLTPKIDGFLKSHLKISLHPNKVTIRAYRQGIDFLGYVSFPNHTVMRLKTKKRMLKNLRAKIEIFKEGNLTEESLRQTLCSYFGILSHCNGHKTARQIMMLCQDLPQRLLYGFSGF